MAKSELKSVSEAWETCWPIVAEFFASRNWPDTKLGNAASELNGRAPEISKLLKKEAANG